jgi:dienelactone hydrolase
MDLGPSFPFDYEGRSYTVYRRGAGPGVLLTHEVPGITPQMVDFMQRVAAAGFTVWMPHLFGEPGKPFSKAYAFSEILRLCIRKEFNIFVARESSPITDMLRALGRRLLAEAGGKGIGAIGMCLTGNFALALMADDFVLAPVLSQPSLPWPAIVRRRKSALHISDQELATVKRRATSGTTVLGFRFSEDTRCPRERFERLHHELGHGFEEFGPIDSRPGNSYGFKPDAHSVLVMEFRDQAGHPTRQAMDRLLSFLHEKLNGT